MALTDAHAILILPPFLIDVATWNLGLVQCMILSLLCQAIAKDAVLSKCKIIAEPWDCGGLYLVGQFPNWDR